MVIKVVLLALVLGMAGYFVSTTNKTKTQAWKKILFTLFALFMGIAIVLPESTNRLAHAVGVGRGADLLLYLLAAAFIFSAIGTYITFQEQRTRINSLARKLALYEAEAKEQARHARPARRQRR